MPRPQIRSEAGMTLVEVLVTLSLLGVVLTIFSGILVSVQAGLERQSDRSQSNDQARLAVQELDREIRSGNVLYDPSAENDPVNGVYAGLSLRVYTQTNAVSRNPGNRCVQWRIVNGELQRRDWATTWRTDPDTLVGDWRIVAENIVNADPNGDGNTADQVAAFRLDDDPSKGFRSVIVTVLANEDRKSGQNIKIQASITGRNTQYGYPNDICIDIPDY